MMSRRSPSCAYGSALLAVAASLVLSAAAPGYASVTRAGDLDRTFSRNGKIYVKIGEPNDEASALAIQPDGNILLAGTANVGVSNSDLGLVRFRPDGTKDPTFGHHGKVQTDLGGDEATLDMALAPDGRIVVVGWNAEAMLVVRYLQDGRLDPGFGDGGVVRVSIDRYTVGYGVAVEPDGSVVAVGLASDGMTGRSVLARFLPDGARDRTFGTRGLVVGRPAAHFIPQDVAVQADGRIVVSGMRYPPGSVEARRYLSDGRRDASFGSRGKVLTLLRRSMRSAVALRSDGDILVTGSVLANGGDFGVVALHPDGSLDTAFGTNGIAGVDFGGGEGAAAVAVAADGSVVLGGDTTNGGRLFAVARLLPDGSPDPSFGDAGRVITGGGELGFVQDIALDAAGRVVAAGVASPKGALRFMALRFIGS